MIGITKKIPSGGLGFITFVILSSCWLFFTKAHEGLFHAVSVIVVVVCFILLAIANTLFKVNYNLIKQEEDQFVRERQEFIDNFKRDLLNYRCDLAEVCFRKPSVSLVNDNQQTDGQFYKSIGLYLGDTWSVPVIDVDKNIVQYISDFSTSTTAKSLIDTSNTINKSFEAYKSEIEKLKEKLSQINTEDKEEKEPYRSIVVKSE